MRRMSCGEFSCARAIPFCTIGWIFAIRPIFKSYHRNTEPKRWRSQVHTYRLYGTLYPEIRNADMRVGYDAYSRYAIGDTIRVYAISSGRVVPVSTVEKMRIWHIGSQRLASEHLPELLVFIGGGFVLWCRRNRRRS